MEEKKDSFGKEMLNTVLYFAGVIVLVIIIQTFIGHQVTVEGSSMEVTLHNKDHLLLEKVTYRFREPKRFDIVVFRPYGVQKNLYYIKRVIGLPGETVLIKDGEIYINNSLLEESYGTAPIIDGGVAGEGILLGEDEYFLLGDNRNNSFDSRSSNIGPVDIDAIIGRAFIRIWPLTDIGRLKDR